MFCGDSDALRSRNCEELPDMDQRRCARGVHHIDRRYCLLQPNLLCTPHCFGVAARSGGFRIRSELRTPWLPPGYREAPMGLRNKLLNDRVDQSCFL